MADTLLLESLENVVRELKKAVAALKTATDQVAQLPVTNYMPAEGEDFEAHAYVALPAIGNSVVVVSVTIPEGRMAILKRLANVFVGGGFQEGQGGIVWQILLDGTDVNNPAVAPFFDAIVASLGSVAAPSQIDGIRCRESTILQLVATNVSIALAGQLIGGRLGGYFYPVELDPDTGGF